MAELQSTVPSQASKNPFPGLRPFRFDESHLFFGRDGQSQQLITKLSAKRFLAVVGTSGSGKSSLVFAGLLPALFGGFMSRGSAWRVTIMRPGDDPLGNLARELSAARGYDSENEKDRALQVALTEATLRRGSFGLVETAREFKLAPSENLLVVADQFEELFRFNRQSHSLDLENDKAAFVKLLLEAKNFRTEGPHIYVVMTMRSDYLGDCAKFWNLPEAINEGQYLIPRMTRQQRREAITGPIAVGGATITPRLLNRLLNDVGDNPDQLPILQHALMQTWNKWSQEQEKGERADGGQGGNPPPTGPIDLPHYEAIGGMAEALSRHADEAFNELDERGKRVAEKMFKCLAVKGADNREGRRPTTIAKLCAITGAGENDVAAVIETFRRKSRSFLVSSTGKDLSPKSLIDISHESLIRNWRGSDRDERSKRLHEWVNDEAQSASMYRRLAETAVLHRKRQAGLWRDPDLQLAVKWRDKQEPNRAWARQYHRGFHLAMRFLKESRSQQEKEILQEQMRQARELRRSRIIAVVLGAAFLVTLLAYLYAQQQKRAAETQRRTAEEQRSANRRLYYNTSINLAKDAFAKGDIAWGRRLLSDFLTDPDGVRGFEWYHLWLRYPREVATIRGHGLPVLAVAFSPAGKNLASGDDNGIVKLWDLTGGKEPVTIKAHSATVLSVAFSPDGNRLATAAADGAVKLWDIAGAPAPSTSNAHGGQVRAVAFFPDGNRLASGSDDGTVKVWDARNGRELATFKASEKAVLSVAISPDGKTLATAGEDGWAKLLESNTGNELGRLDGKGNRILTVAFSPTGNWVAAGSEDGTVWLWETAPGKKERPLKFLRTPVWTVAFSPDGQRLVTGSDDGLIRLWETNSGQELASLNAHKDPVRAVAFSPDDITLASGSFDGTVKLWETSGGKEVATLKNDDWPVNASAYWPDEKKIASASEEGTVRIWDLASRQVIKRFGERGVALGAVAVSSDGKRLATGSAEGTVRIWDFDTGQDLASIRAHGSEVRAVAFSPDGKSLASSGEDGKVMLWNASTGSELATLKGTGEAALSVTFSSDGTQLAAGIGDGTILLWPIGGGREPATFRGHQDRVEAVSFSRDGKRLASGSTDGTVRLWDARRGQLLLTLGVPGTVITSVAFSPDGKRLASGSEDGRVKLWETDIGQEIITLRGQGKPIRSVVFSPTGTSLASGGGDGALRLWFAARAEDVPKPGQK